MFNVLAWFFAYVDACEKEVYKLGVRSTWVFKHAFTWKVFSEALRCSACRETVDTALPKFNEFVDCLEGYITKVIDDVCRSVAQSFRSQLMVWWHVR